MPNSKADQMMRIHGASADVAMISSTTWFGARRSAAFQERDGSEGEWTGTKFNKQTAPQSHRIALLCLVLAPVLWGGNFVVAKVAVADIEATWLNVFRWVVAGALLLPFAWARMWSERHELLAHWFRILTLALLGVVGFNTVLYLALSSVPASIAAIGFATTPIMVALLQSLCHARLPSAMVILSSLGSLAGVYFVVGVSSGPCVSDAGCIDPHHLALVFLAALIWALYCVALRHIPIKASPLSVLTAKIAIGMAIQVPFSLILFDPPAISNWSIETYLSLGYLGLFASATAFLCWTLALRVIAADRASLFLNLVPITSLGLGIAFLGETLRPEQVFGALVVFSSLFAAASRGDLRRT